MIARPFCGSLPAMTPVSTRGTLGAGRSRDSPIRRRRRRTAARWVMTFRVERAGLHHGRVHGGRLGAPAGEVGHDERGLHKEGHAENDRGDARSFLEQQGAPALLRRESLQPGNRVHGQKSMSLNVVLRAART